MKASDNFTKAIESYLDSEKQIDTELATAIETHTDRNIEGCCNYIMKEVKKLAGKENGIAMTPEEVYKIAKAYYFAAETEINPPVKARVEVPSTTYTPKPTPTPKPKAPVVGDLFSLFDELENTENNEAEK